MVKSHQPKPKIVFVVTEDWAVLSHRLPMARAARDMGFDVIIATKVSDHEDEIAGEGFRVINIPFNRGNVNPIAEIRAVFALVRLFWHERPDVVHNIALKPIIDGTFAARLSPVKNTLNTFTGMGSLYIGDGGLFRRIMSGIIKLLSCSRKVSSIAENMDDYKLLLEMKVSSVERLHIVHGSGIDTDTYSYQNEPVGSPIVTMVGRLLIDKGVREFIQAAGRVRRQRPDVRFILAGNPDDKNPRSITHDALRKLNAGGDVELLGHVTDTKQLWTESHIAVLPSYREGMPMSLLEASAVGRAMVTTDTPGCRDLVRDGINGILVPVRDSERLTSAILHLVENPDERLKMGKAARSIVESEYSDDVVARKMQSLYKAAIN